MSDLISRQAAIDAVNTALFPKINTAKDAEKALRALPSAQPERKTGKWINVNNGKWNTIEVLKCSVCGEIDNRMYKTDNFCPNCGADMRGEQDDESRSNSNAQTDTRARGMGATDKSSGI